MRYVEHVEFLYKVLVEGQSQVDLNPDLIFRLGPYVIDNQGSLCYHKVDIDSQPVVQVALGIFQRKSEDIDGDLAICSVGIEVPVDGLDMR